MQKQKKMGKNIEKDWEKQNISLAHSLQQNKLHKFLTNPLVAFGEHTSLKRRSSAAKPSANPMGSAGVTANLVLFG